MFCRHAKPGAALRGPVSPYVCLRWSSSEIHSASTQEIAVFSGFFFVLPAPSKTIGSCRVPVAIAAQVGVGAGAGAGDGADAGDGSGDIAGAGPKPKNCKTASDVVLVGEGSAFELGDVDGDLSSSGGGSGGCGACVVNGRDDSGRGDL